MSPTMKVFLLPRSRAETTDVQLSLAVSASAISFSFYVIFTSVFVCKLIEGWFCVSDTWGSGGTDISSSSCRKPPMVEGPRSSCAND